MLTIEKLCELRTHLYHLTAWSNLAGIRLRGGLAPAAALLRESGHDTTYRRPNHLTLPGNQYPIQVRDQAPLHEGAIAFESGWDMVRLVAHINEHVFFWPGTLEGPIAAGRNHYARYACERPALLRTSTRGLLAANPAIAPLMCRFNSGAPRVSNGRHSSRGKNTYVTAAEFTGPASRVVEVVFRGFVRLPADTTVSHALSGPWEHVYADGTARAG